VFTIGNQFRYDFSAAEHFDFATLFTFHICAHRPRKQVEIVIRVG
jgi:hypothetical protein